MYNKSNEMKSFFTDFCYNNFNELDFNEEGLKERKILSDIDILNIKNIITQKNITQLIHFTKAENLPSILENGILSRAEIEERNISAQINDNQRLDGCTDAISVSIEQPNREMFHALRYKEGANDWVMLSINPKILYEKSCAFCQTNAANHNERTIPIKCRQGSNGFERMYHGQSNVNSPYPPDPQAEVLVFDKISKDDIYRIYFENERCKQQYKKYIPVYISAMVKTKYF